MMDDERHFSAALPLFLLVVGLALAGVIWFIGAIVGLW